jgi:phosphoserine aminotransferase
MAQISIQALRELQNSLNAAIDRYAETSEKSHHSASSAKEVSDAAAKISDVFKVPVLEVSRIGF